MESISLHCVYICDWHLCQDISASKVRECNWGCVLKRNIWTKEIKVRETGKHCAVRRVKKCTLQKLLFGWWHLKGWCEWGMGNEGQRIATHGYFGGKIYKKKPREVCKRRWERNIKIYLKETGRTLCWLD
jgi:hypothetical protein